MLDVAAVLSELVRRQHALPDGMNRTDSTTSVEQLASKIVEYAKQDPDTFSQMLRTALEEVSRRIDHVSLAVTGLAWLGSGTTSVEQEMLSLVQGAHREISLCAYSITTGAMPLLRVIKEVVAEGIMTTFVVNGFSRQSTEVQAYLKDLVQAFPQRCKLLDFVPMDPRAELHAKVLVVDRSAALVGSANLSFHGMVSNHEMAVVVRGPTADWIAARIDMLTQGASVRDVMA